MSKVSVGSEKYEVATVNDQDQILTEIDFLALRFYSTKNLRERDLLFASIYMRVIPFIHKIVGAYAYTIPQERDEIEAILSGDLWRLLKKWTPKVEYLQNTNKSCRFHYLMFRQLRNKVINEVKSRTKAQMTKRHVDLNQTISIDNLPESTIEVNYNTLEVLAGEDFIKKLLDSIKDPKTRKILELVKDGATVSEIKKEINGKALRAIKRRQELCRPAVITLLAGSYTDFVSSITKTIADDTERMIIQKYCMGRDIHEIRTSMKIKLSVVKSCLEKYRPRIVATLMRG